MRGQVGAGINRAVGMQTDMVTVQCFGKFNTAAMGQRVIVAHDQD